MQIQSSSHGKRFELTKPNVTFYDTNKFESKESNAIYIDMSKAKQTIVGFGGAFTDAAVININNLPTKLGETLLESYFGNTGLEYNMARVPIAGSDFSNRTYSYDDTNEPDFELRHWSLADEDTKLKIPFIKTALKIASRDKRNIKLFASPWSPPKWMKDNENFVHGHLKDDSRVYKAYADYLVRFFEAYKDKGIEFWGATVQNEPISSLASDFSGLEFSYSEQKRFIPDFLGPVLESKGYNKTNFKLMIGDDNLGLVETQVPDLLKDSRVTEYVSGLAFHWYSHSWISYSELSRLYDSIKDKIEFVLMTEACTGADLDNLGPKPGSWDRGESYANDIIEDLNRYVSGWIDWNLALDMNGGPNWSKNFVDSPILVNTTQQSKEFYKQPMYYALGHFSKFFKPGDKIVNTNVNKLFNLKATAVERQESGHLIVNVVNSESKERTIRFIIKKNNGNVSSFELELDSKSINTILIRVDKSY